MTKEELVKEAKDSWWNDNNCSGALPTEKIYECGYIAGAEPREKRIAELEAQIEKMKRYLDCEYCEHYTQSYGCKNCNEELRSDWSLRR